MKLKVIEEKSFAENVKEFFKLAERKKRFS